VTDNDRRRWDERYASQAEPSVNAVAPPASFATYTDVFPTVGQAIDLACGQGLGAVWLAIRGLTVLGLDISEVAIARARDLAQRSGVRIAAVLSLSTSMKACRPVRRSTSSSATNSATAALTGR
jgi:2-polyprenyl-3-methyl-5-hydroxy-6-metoxy-1,4-benzoquinol methylase